MKIILLLFLSVTSLCAYDRWRVVEGKTYDMKSPQYEFLAVGEAKDFVKEGIICEAEGGTKFLIKHYPNEDKVTTGRLVPIDAAIEVGTFNYMGARLRAFDYGTSPSQAIIEEKEKQERIKQEAKQRQQDELAARLASESAQEKSKREAQEKQEAEQKQKAIAAAKEAQAKQKAAQLAKLINFEREKAEEGYPSFQYSLGMRYLKGDGVETNKVVAREWLEKSAAQGNASAEQQLKQMK